MSVALHVDLRTPARDLDPATALADLRGVLSLLRDMEATLERDDAFDATAWRFRSLSVGSIAAVFEPADQGSTTRRRSAEAGLLLVRGFRAAEHDTAIPEAWSTSAARKATRISAHLGADRDRGLQLRLVVDGDDQATAEVTAAAAHNLRTATRASHDSIGSVVGTIGSMSVRGSNTAGLWPERGPRVTVRVPTERVDEVSAALARRDCVQVSGLLERNSRGQLLRIKLRRLQVLPRPEVDQPWSLGGIGPNLTGGVDPVEYLRRMRDSS